MKKIIILISTVLFSCTLFAQVDLVTVFEEVKEVQLKPIIVDLNLNRGDAKSIIPVQVPEGAEYCYYIVTIAKENWETCTPYKDRIEALENLSPEKVPGHLTLKESKKNFNVYVLENRENADRLKDFGYYEYLKKHTKKKSVVGYIDTSERQEFFIGLENNYELKSVKLRVEVLAAMPKSKS